MTVVIAIRNLRKTKGDYCLPEIDWGVLTSLLEINFLLSLLRTPNAADTCLSLIAANVSQGSRSFTCRSSFRVTVLGMIHFPFSMPKTGILIISRHIVVSTCSLYAIYRYTNNERVFSFKHYCSFTLKVFTTYQKDRQEWLCKSFG